MASLGKISPHNVAGDQPYLAGAQSLADLAARWRTDYAGDLSGGFTVAWHSVLAGNLHGRLRSPRRTHVDGFARQTDPALCPRLRHVDCYFLCHVLPEQLHGPASREHTPASM